jgi:hypothetical protein
MAYGSWEAVIREYNDIYINTRFGEHAKGILNLIPVIREQVDLTNVIPSTSHATLVLQYPDTRVSVRIWCEGDDIYTVGSCSERVKMR